MDHHAAVIEAQVQDAAAILERAAGEISRVAPVFDAISENTLSRVVGQLRTITKLKRPRTRLEPVPVPGDVAF